MRNLLILILSALAAPLASAVPLDTIGTFCSTFPDQCRKGTESLLAVRGTGTNAYYVLEADPTTGALPVNVTSGSISVTIPANGPTGSAVPAQADYQGLNNSGTLIGAIGDSSGRAIVAGGGTAGTPAGGVLSVQGVGSGTALPVSQSTSPWVVAGGGTAGSAATGVVTVQGISSMTALKVDGTGGTFPVSGTVAATQSGTWNINNVSGTVSLPTGAATDSTLSRLTNSQGAVSSGLYGTLMMGNATTAAPSYSTATSNPLSLTTTGALRVDATGVNQPTNIAQFGGNNVATGTGISGNGIPRVTVSSDSTVSLTAGSAIIGKVGIDQTTPGTTNAISDTNFPSTVSVNAGAASASTIRVVAATDSSAGAGRAYADSVRYAYSSGAVGTGSWVQLIASTAALINCIQVFDSSGQTLELGTGAPASETRVLIIPPGGLDGCVPLKVAASTRIAIRALSATTGTVGEIDITGLN